MRTLYDAVTPGNIPADAQMVAGYVDGRYAWHANDWARFPSAVKVRIAVFSSTNDGHVLDIEPGCSTPASAPGWVQRRRAAGVDPSVYCNTSTWPVVRAAFAAAGVREPHYWIAAYPGIGPNLYLGSVAHQYANPGPVDISVVADYWPGVDTAHVVSAAVTTPAAPALPESTSPTQPTEEEDDMRDNFAAMFRANLGREASAAELDGRVDDAIRNGKTLAQVRAEIVTSDEAKRHAIASAFPRYLGRAASPAETTAWLKAANSDDITAGVANSNEAIAYAKKA